MDEPEDEALFPAPAAPPTPFPRVVAHEDHKRFVIAWARGSASLLNGVTGRLWPPATPEALLSRGDWTTVDDLGLDEVLRGLPDGRIAVYERPPDAD